MSDEMVNMGNTDGSVGTVENILSEDDIILLNNTMNFNYSEYQQTDSSFEIYNKTVPWEEIVDILDE